MSLTSLEEPAGVNFSLPFPPRASVHRELQFAGCLRRGRKGQEPHKQGEKQSGAAQPPGLLIPPDIRSLMNVLSWSREYCRKLSPPASPAFCGPLSYQGYLTWHSRERGATAAGRLLPGASHLDGGRGERGQHGVAFLTLPLAAAVPLTPTPYCLRCHWFRFILVIFWVRIILILFCLHNPDCYHPTNYSHIFLQTANGRDKTAAGLYDFCLSNYCNYLKNGLKLYGVMNLITSLQRCLVLHAACKWARLWEVLHKAAAGGIAPLSLRREAPAPLYHSKGGRGTPLQVGLTNRAHHSTDQLS